MSYLVLGLSHSRTPISVLEAAALDRAAITLLSDALADNENVRELAIVSTCNRTELIADVSTFHGGMEALTEAFTSSCSVTRDDLAVHGHVHFEQSAVDHVFHVAAGLDSMALGEAQILSQLREALSAGQERGDTGTQVSSLLQNALRVGKKVHSDTEIDTVSRSLVTVGLDAAAARLAEHGSAMRSVLVIGAGAMSALAATTVSRRGDAALTIINRTPERAEELAERLAAASMPWADLATALARADVVISCTGSPEVMIDLQTAVDSQAARDGRPQVYLDLALPHDVSEQIGQLRGVERLGLSELGQLAGSVGAEGSDAVEHARTLVRDEIERFIAARASTAAVPTLTAMRTAANSVMEQELARLEQRTPEMGEYEREQVQQSMRRLVDKMLHRPTISVKQMAASGNFGHYEDTIALLFDLGEEPLSDSAAAPSSVRALSASSPAASAVPAAAPPVRPGTTKVPARGTR